jgi:small subunit ribosomal protein S17
MAVKELVGIVVSDKMMDTRVIAVSSRIPHKNYRKVITTTKRYMAHDPCFSAKLGDKVKMRETRPVSKCKRWVLTDVLEKSST